MTIKNIILTLSFLGGLFAWSVFYGQVFDICSIYCGPALGEWWNLLLFFPFIFLFSLITYFNNVIYFSKWWKFARLTVPLVFVAQFIIGLGLHHNPGGWFSMDQTIDLFILFALYGFFVLGSLFQMFRAYVESTKYSIDK